MIYVNITQRPETQEVPDSANTFQKNTLAVKPLSFHVCYVAQKSQHRALILSKGADQHGQTISCADLKRLLAWQTLPLAVYSILNSKDISHDRLNSFSGSGMMESIAFLTAGMKNSTCGHGDM